ncbi:MAG TPA: M17 family peptidase N-terminal domain-containing protein, partial [Acidimicrobiia bacterium]|nr:M17 family peptidase N-terminal domain-containing protein [Acidimicrobiia bacterium]
MEIRAIAASVDLDDATLIIGIMEGLEPVTGSEEEFEALDRSALEAGGFEGKPGQTLTLPHGSAKAVLVVGLGEETSFDSLRAASGNAVR